MWKLVNDWDDVDGSGRDDGRADNVDTCGAFARSLAPMCSMI